MFKVKFQFVILSIIIALGVFLRVYRLAEFPVHLGHDEITQLYDAVSIAQTAKDIYGNFLPTIFESVHDFKPPFYTYATVLSYWIFGNHEFVIRVPSVFFGILLIPAIYFFALKLLKDKKIALYAAFVSAISPFELFFSRKSFENGAGIVFMLFGFTSFLVFLERKEKKWAYIGSLLLVLGMYTYFSHVFIIPLLITVFVYLFRMKLKERGGFLKDKIAKYYFPIALFSLLLAVPLILIILLNPGSRNRSQAVFITQDINLGQQINNISSENSFVSTLLKYKTIADFSFNRYLSQFDPEYLFLNGLDLTNQGPIGSGPFLFIQLPFILLGLVTLIKKKDLLEQKKFILAWIIIGFIPSGITFEVNSPHRVIMVFTMLNIISAVGFGVAVSCIKQKKYPYLLKISLFSAIILTLIINFSYFVHLYTVNFPFEKSQFIHYPFKQVALFAWSQYDNFDQIVFDPEFGEIAPMIGTGAHYYMAYYGNYSPAILQKEYRLGNKDREVLFGKFSIRKVKWGEDLSLKNTLIIVSPWSVQINNIDKSKIIKVINYYDKTPAFYGIKL